MERLLTDYLDDAVKTCPDRVAFEDENRSITYKELQIEAYTIAAELTRKKIFKQPVLVIMPSCIECAVFAYGVAYSGNFFSIANKEMTKVEEVIRQFEPAVILTNTENANFLKHRGLNNIDTIIYEECARFFGNSNEEFQRCQVLPRDPIAVVFTSGSTGYPKGVVISNEYIIRMVKQRINILKIDENSRLAEPNPSIFINFMTNLFLVVVSKSMSYIFSSGQLFFSAAFLEKINEKELNRMICVSTLLTLITKQKTLSEMADVSCLKVIEIGGAPISPKTINEWRNQLKNTEFYYTYGSTETMLVVRNRLDQFYQESEVIPLGKVFSGVELYILNGQHQVVQEGDIGMLYVKSDRLALGYYKDKEKTDSVFVQNPLHTLYPDIVYKTGDMVRLDKHGNLIFAGRKDSMIKRRGFRIELGEIDSKASTLKGIKECISIYNEKTEKICFFYEGEISEADVHNHLVSSLRSYMLPECVIKVDAIPHGTNSKVDRQILNRMIEEKYLSGEQ